MIPIILVPIILSRIGEVQFGIYAIVIGLITAFGILDLGVSSSFVKYISEFNIKKDFISLNKFITTSLIYYIMFSIAVIATAYMLSFPLINIFNIPDNLKEISQYVFKISLISFFFSNITTVFTCVLFSTHNIYKTSIIGVVLHMINFITTVLLLELGYGLASLFYVNLGISLIVFIMNLHFARQSIPLMQVKLRYFDTKMLKRMLSFGTIMQVARISQFIADKFDELLLGHLTNLTNVTYYNTSSRIVRAGRFFPMQITPQANAASAELYAKNETAKIAKLHSILIRLMLLMCLPIFMFLIVFSDGIIKIWLGDGFETSAFLMKILACGIMTNLILSLPGNAVLPGMGLPKFIMYEGLINMAVNVGLSWLLIINYGVEGAAYGTAAALIISSTYLFLASNKVFKYPLAAFLWDTLKPVVVIIILSFIVYCTYRLAGMEESSRISIFGILTACGLLFLGSYFYILKKLNYFTDLDKSLLRLITPNKIYGMLNRFIFNK